MKCLKLSIKMTFTIHYENLVQKPMKEMKRIQSFLKKKKLKLT